MALHSEEKIVQGALHVLFEENYQRVYKLAYSITLDSELAKDATQETFVRAFTRIHTLREKSKFTSWICSITVNVCKDILKKNNTYKKRNISIYDDEGSEKSNIVSLATADLPQELCEDKEMRQQLLRCIDELGPDDKMLIHFRYYEELTCAQIAECMQSSEGAVRMRLQRVKQKIAKKFYFFNRE